MNLLRAFWHSPTALDWAFRVLVVIGLLVNVWLVVVWLAQQPAFVLRSVVVTASHSEQGLRHVSEADIRQALETGLVTHTFHSSLQPAAQQLAAHPWVRQVTLRRAWPNRLLIRIEEHQPIAAWSDGRLLNQQGELFVGEKTAALEDAETLYQCRLVDLTGPLGSHQRVLGRALATETLLAQHGRRLEAVSLTAQASWSIRLDEDLLVLLGREDLSTDWQVRLGQAMESLPRLDHWLDQSNSADALSRVDLRYANGFSYATESRPPDARSALRMRPVPSCLKHYRQGSRHAA